MSKWPTLLSPPGNPFWSPGNVQGGETRGKTSFDTWFDVVLFGLIISQQSVSELGEQD